MSDQPSTADQLKSLQQQLDAEDLAYCQEAMKKIQALADDLGVQIAGEPAYTVDGRTVVRIGVIRRATRVLSP